MKRVFAILLCIVVFLSLSVCAYAAEDTAAEGTPETGETANAGDAVTETDSEFSVKEFLLGIVPDASTVINLALSLALMLIYKKSLIPSLGNGLGIVAQGVENIRKAFDESKADNLNSISEIRSQVESAVSSIGKYMTEIVGITENNHKSMQIMLMFCAMLKEGFMCANLPTYAKERINAYYEKALAVADDGDGNGEKE